MTAFRGSCSVFAPPPRRTTRPRPLSGQPLRVPREFLPDAAAPWQAASHRAVCRGVAGSHPDVPPPPSADLPSARYVFIRHDGHRNPLHLPYDGPFWRWALRTLLWTWVDADRLKPAHLDTCFGPSVVEPPAPLDPPPARRSRFGQVVRPPATLTVLNPFQ